MKRYTRIDFLSRIDLYLKQKWLINKKDELSYLLEQCNSKDEKDLLYFLLEKFKYLEVGDLRSILNDISDYIISESKFEESTTQILSITYDDNPDSSQKILDMLKVPLFQKGWKSVKKVNHYSKAMQNYKKGKTNILVIDEFIGSGITLKGRLKQLKNDINGEFNIKFCFVAGIKETIQHLKSEGLEIYTPLLISKGISSNFKDIKLNDAINTMQNLESKLAKRINNKNLDNYSFGYGEAEALYTMEGCLGNTPNSVFPIFWWSKDANNNNRKTLLTRAEEGF